MDLDRNIDTLSGDEPRSKDLGERWKWRHGIQHNDIQHNDV
jgi:hypothetical protein